MPDPLRDPVRGSSTATQRLPDNMSDQELAQLAYDRLVKPQESSELSDEEVAARMEEPAEPELSDEEVASRMTPTAQLIQARFTGPTVDVPLEAEPTGQAGQQAQTRVGTIPAMAVGSAVRSVPQEQPAAEQQLQADPMQMDRERVFNLMQRAEAAGMPISPDYDISQIRTEVKQNPEALTVYSEEMFNAQEQVEALLYRIQVLQEALSGE